MGAAGNDGLPITEVGEWAVEKHERLGKYVDITKATRRKYTVPTNEFPVVGGAAYIDLFCGSGLARVRETGAIIDGSPLIAAKAAGTVPFSEIHLGDLNSDFSSAAAQRVRAIGGIAFDHTGTAEETALEIVTKLNPNGLHFAFLDPFSLESLTWRCIELLAQLSRIDMLVHVSVSDLQRNFDLYSGMDDSPLDAFAPGWRSAVKLDQSKTALRAAYMSYWEGKTRELGFSFRGSELVTGSKSQRLYWLIFLSRNKFANDLWDKIRHISGQKSLDF